MSVSEMLENAVKYSQGKKVRLLMEKHGDGNKIEIMVYNYASPEQIQRLSQTLEEMKRSEPLAFYLKKMEESVNQPPGRNQIGLARIRYEAGAELSLQLLDNELLEAKAIIQL